MLNYKKENQSIHNINRWSKNQKCVQVHHNLDNLLYKLYQDHHQLLQIKEHSLTKNNHLDVHLKSSKIQHIYNKQHHNLDIIH